jgi:hypothetical protein
MVAVLADSLSWRSNAAFTRPDTASGAARIQHSTATASYLATCTFAAGATRPGAMMVTEAKAILLGSDLLAAVTVAGAFVVTSVAVKLPEGLMVLTAVFPLAVPFTDQITSAASPVTAALMARSGHRDSRRLRRTGDGDLGAPIIECSVAWLSLVLPPKQLFQRANYTSRDYNGYAIIYCK